MDERFKGIMIGTVASIVTIGVYQAYKLYSKATKKYQYLKDLTPIDVDELQKLKKKKGNTFVLRVQPKLQINHPHQQYDLCTNHLNFSFPDERQYAQQMTRDLQYTSKQTIWRGYDPKNSKKYINLNGFGTIYEGVIQVDVKAIIKSNKSFSFWDLLHSKVTFFLQWCVSSLFLILFGTNKSNVFLKGVKIGSFHVNYNWIRGNVLVECELTSQNSFNIKGVGVSMDSFISASQNKVIETKYNFFGFLIAWGAITYYLYRFYRRYRIQKQKRRQRRKQVVAFRNRQLVFEADNQQQTCIICLTNNKNVILGPCCHLAICSICLPSMKNKNQCPLCKSRLNATKIYSTPQSLL